MNYLEPYFGSGAVFFTKQRSMIETINDIDGQVVNLFRVVRERGEELADAIALTPWARDEYRLSYEAADDELEQARRFLVRMWQAIGAKSSTTTGWRKNVKGVNGNLPKFHMSLPADILEVCERLKHSGSHIVQIENKDALELIRRGNSDDTLIYADPPYVLSTRSSKIYKHEYTDSDHAEMLDALTAHKGPVLISGYDNSLYAEALAGWYRDSVCTTAENATTREEVLWCNYQPTAQGKFDFAEGI